MTSSALKSLILYGVSGAAASLMPLAITPFLASQLNVEDLASYILVTTSIALVTPFFGLGAANIAPVRFITSGADIFSQLISGVVLIIIGSSLLLLCISWTGSGFLQKIWGVDVETITVVIACALLLSLGLLFTSVLVSAGDDRGYARAFVSFSIVTIFATVILVAQFRLGLLGAFIGLLLGYFTLAALSCKTVGLSISISRRSFRYIPEALRFGLPLMLHSFSLVLIGYADRMAMVAWADKSAVAAYGVTAQFAVLIGLLCHSVIKVLQPKLYGLLAIGKAHSDSEAVDLVFVYTAFVLVVSGAYAVGFSSLLEIIAPSGLVLGPEVYVFNMIGAVFYSLYLVFTHFIFFKSKTLSLGMVTVATALVHVVLLWGLTPRFQATGAAMSYAISALVMCLCSFVVAKGCVRVPWWSADRLKSVSRRIRQLLVDFN
jgi:O-antigen/teichoic acid export membrane protein